MLLYTFIHLCSIPLYSILLYPYTRIPPDFADLFTFSDHHKVPYVRADISQYTITIEPSMRQTIETPSRAIEPLALTQSKPSRAHKPNPQDFSMDVFKVRVRISVTIRLIERGKGSSGLGSGFGLRVRFN